MTPCILVCDKVSKEYNIALCATEILDSKIFEIRIPCDAASK
jgi:hypothetical protein